MQQTLIDSGLSWDTAGIVVGYLTPLPPLPYLDQLVRNTREIAIALDHQPSGRCDCAITCDTRIKVDKLYKDWIIIWFPTGHRV